MREIILDTETTGLDPYTGHRVIEVGALEMINKVLTGNKFHYFLNPERDVPIEAQRIHGISTEFLHDKPKFQEIADELWHFIDGAVIVAHNAQFDMKFLNYELSIISQKSIDYSNVVDTLAIARKKFPGAKVNLDALCKRFKVDNSNREFHGALKDAALLAEVYVELCGGRQSSFVFDDSVIDNKITAQFNTTSLGNKILKTPTEEEFVMHENFMKRIIENAK